MRTPKPKTRNVSLLTLKAAGNVYDSSPGACASRVERPLAVRVRLAVHVSICRSVWVVHYSSVKRFLFLISFFFSFFLKYNV